MRDGGAALGLLGLVLVLSRRRSSSSPAPSSPAPSSPGPVRVPIDDAAPRTGFEGRDAWAQWVRQVEPIARAQLRAAGASDVEQIVGAHALSALGLSEHSGRAEYGFNVGNMRPVGSQQDRARWPNGLLYRVFPSREDGIRATLEALRGRRYGPAWAQLVQLAAEGSPLEPLIGGWFAAIHDAGWTDGPSRDDARARDAWLSQLVQTGQAVSGLVTRALARSEGP